MKKLLIFLGVIILGLPVFAQDYDAERKQINSIKKSNNYIYGEATAESEEDAKSIAEDILYQEINKWVATQKKLKGSTNIVVNNRKELQTFYTLTRGNMYRHFVYVKKSDLIPVENAEVIGNPAGASQDISSLKSKVETIDTRATKVQYPEVVNELAAYTDYYNMADKIKEFKEAGKISYYARYTSLEKPEIYYLAIYNTSGKVVAILSPGENRTNVVTGQPDKVTNYSGCGAIGFKVKE